MAGIAGTVYPNLSHINHLTSQMLDTISYREETPTREITMVKDFQVGICGGSLARTPNTIVGLDGALYNKQSLREKLKNHGFAADESTSDPMLLAYAYEAWGAHSFLKYVDGDFAFFLVDQQKVKLILARDRIGKKPLYWYQDQDQFLFASEIKALLASGVIPQTPAPDAIASYLYFGYIPQDLSPIQKVNKLLPAYYLQLNQDGSISIDNYWSYSSQFQQKPITDIKMIVPHLKELLETSITERLTDQTPFGCFLSGGPGSAAIADYLSNTTDKDRIQAYTVAYQGENLEDLLAAQEVACNLQLQHFCEVITPQTFLDDIVNIVWHLDEPLADPNVVASWRLACMGGPGKVVYSGMGSDELFAGHGRYTVEESPPEKPFDWISDSVMPFIRQLLLPVLNTINKAAAYGILQQSRINPWQLDFLNQNALFTDDIRKLAAPRIAHLFDPHVFLHKFHNLSLVPSAVSSYLYLDVKTRLVDCYILQYERCTAAHRKDWRTPFLSQELFEFVARIPEPNKLHAQETSYLLKALLDDNVKKTLATRPKRTRKDFLKSWVDSSGLSQLFLLLSRGTLVESGIISERWLRMQLDTPAQRHESFRYLWAILMLEIWFRLFINFPVGCKPPHISLEDLLSE